MASTTYRPSCPWQGGGEMIDRVSFEGTTFQPPPFRFEAGTPHIAGAIGLANAIMANSFDRHDMNRHHELEFSWELDNVLRSLDGVKVLGTGEKLGIASFCIRGCHYSDAGTPLDQLGIAVRAGHHCCQPLYEVRGIPGSVRASISCYSNEGDLIMFEQLLQEVLKIVAVLTPGKIQ